MNNITKFESSSSFETASGGGTLAYPNTSLIEETQSLYIRQTQPPQEITFYIYGHEHKALSGMTWSEWCRYGIGVEVDGLYDAFYSIYPGYNDGSTVMDDRRPGCDMTWTVTADNRIGTDTHSVTNTWWTCVSAGWAYIKDVLPSDVIEAGRNYDIE